MYDSIACLPLTAGMGWVTSCDRLATSHENEKRIYLKKMTCFTIERLHM